MHDITYNIHMRKRKEGIQCTKHANGKGMMNKDASAGFLVKYG